MKVVGLTGFFRRHGVPVIDCDEIAHAITGKVYFKVPHPWTIPAVAPKVIICCTSRADGVTGGSCVHLEAAYCRPTVSARHCANKSSAAESAVVTGPAAGDDVQER